MTKKELAINIAARTELPQKQINLVLDAFVAELTEVLKKEDKLQLIGLGTFETKERKARTGRNVKTGETIEIPAKKVPVFKAGKALKDAVK